MTTDPPLQITRQFPATPQQVFDAWLEPGIMQHWLFKGETNEIIDIQIERRPGGAFSILERNQGELIDHFGSYSAIDPPAHLAFSLQVPKHFQETTQVTVRIYPTGSGSEMIFIQCGIAPEITAPFWRQMFDRLGTALNGDRR